MTRYEIDEEEEDLEAQERGRFLVSAEFLVSADTLDEAEEKVRDMIEKGLEALKEDEEEERETIYEYSITDVEPTEFV